MNHELSLATTVDINASPERVWEVMTTPALIKSYLHGTECITDWQVGSEVVFQGEYDGQKYKDHGIIRENTPTELLSYTYWTGFSGLPDAPENYGLVTYRLQAQGAEQTRFTWEQKGYVDEARLAHSKQSMPAFLAEIKKIAEGLQ